LLQMDWINMDFGAPMHSVLGTTPSNSLSSQHDQQHHSDVSR